MPPAQPSGQCNPTGKPHGTVKTVPYKPAGNLHFPQLLLISRLFVGRGLDPSLLICGYRLFPRRGGVTPPYTAISPPASPSYRCARAARTPYLLFIIYYLNCPAGAISSPMAHPSPTSREIATKKQPYVFRKAVLWYTMWEETRTLLCIWAVSAFLHPNGTCLVQ